ncbi:MAG: hypothetical protein ACMUJM_25675 [bacterium]
MSWRMSSPLTNPYGQRRVYLWELFNGDSIIIPEATQDSAVKDYIIDVITCTGGTLDLSGKQGVTEQNINDFMAAVIGSAFAFITKTLAGMSRTQALFGFLGGHLS